MKPSIPRRGAKGSGGKDFSQNKFTRQKNNSIAAGIGVRNNSSHPNEIVFS
jgi:hypothetical protein